MKMTPVLLILAVAASFGQAEEVNPIQKVLEMITDLQAKIQAEGAEAQKVYEEYAEFCEDRSKELGFEIKTGKAAVEDLNAAISEQSAKSASLTAKIEELSGKTSKGDGDLKAAVSIRDKEQKDFAVEEKDLSGVIDTLGRAISIMEKEMSKSGASMLQLKSARNMVEALRAMVDASMLSSADGSKLTALAQSSQGSEDSDSEMGAPDPAVYKSQSGGIIDVMQGLFEKAETQLAELRKKETADIQAFNMLKQSLEDETKYAKKELAEAKTGVAAAEEKKATAEGELALTSKDLATDVSSLSELHQDCMTKASDFEDETNSRGEELKAMASAKKIIVEATSLAQEGQDSFLQVRRAQVSSHTQSKNFQAVQIIRDLAKAQKSATLTQLASRLSSTLSNGARSGEDVFGKVKALIQDMIASLESEAEADASKKAYCDKENAESAEKKDAKEAEVEKLTTSIDSMTARIAALADEISTAQKELGEVAKAQAEMDKVRLEEKALFEKTSAEQEKGLKGIKLAIKTLTDYYAKSDKSHGSADGAGSGIISMLEVAESDFTKELAESVSTEESAAGEYEKETKENELTTTTKEQDVKYKTKETKSLKKDLAETKEDLSGVTEELDAVLEYVEKLKGKCFPVPAESYEERVKRREAEIEGCKNALAVLEDEAASLMQKTSLRRVKRV